MSVIKHITYAGFLVIVKNNQFAVSGRKKEDKYVGFDKSNQTIGYSYYPNSKESSEKILKGIWLVLGIFFLAALFLLCRFLYKASSVLCLHKQGKGEYYEKEIIFSVWPSGRVIKTEEEHEDSIKTEGANKKAVISKKKKGITPKGRYLQHTVVSDLLVYEKIIGLKTGVWPAVNDGI